MKIKKGDSVKILRGKDRGKVGKVIRVAPELEKVVVEGLNLHVKHQRPRRQGEKGQRIQFPAPLSLANVMLVCPSCGKPSRVGFLVREGGGKRRQCKHCHSVL